MKQVEERKLFIKTIPQIADSLIRFEDIINEIHEKIVHQERNYMAWPDLKKELYELKIRRNSKRRIYSVTIKKINNE